MKKVESKHFHNKSVFSTDNFALAVFLKTKAFKCLQISKDNPKHAFFHFEDSSEREKLISEFWEGTASVEPRAFYNNQRELKTLLYDNSYSG